MVVTLSGTQYVPEISHGAVCECSRNMPVKSSLCRPDILVDHFRMFYACPGARNEDPCRTISGPAKDVPRTYLGCFFVVRERWYIAKRLLIAVDRLVSNSPLQVSMYLAVETVKAPCMEAIATWAQNYLRKASFVDVGPDAQPNASEGRWGGDLWQHIVDYDIWGRGVTLTWTTRFLPIMMLALRNRAQTG